MRFIRSLLFMLTMLSTSVIFWPLAHFARTLPPVKCNRFIAKWSYLNIAALRFFCGIDFRVEGIEHLPGRPSVVLSKHQSAWETLAFQLIFPPLSWILKRNLLWIPFFGWALAQAHPIAINRSQVSQALRVVLREGQKRLRQGLWVVIFPEGTRTEVGSTTAYNPGGAMLACRAGVPVVPVAHNAGVFWPRKAFIKRPGTITVRIGQAIDTHGRNAKEVNRLAEAWIENQMQQLTP